MPTRLYLPSTSAAPPISPAVGTGWTATATTGFVRLLAPDTLKTNTALTDHASASPSAVNPSTCVMRQYIFGPLLAQTVSGTLTGVIRGLESNANLNSTVAICVRQVSSTGTHVADLLAVAASDNTAAAPPEFATSAATRRFQDVNEATSLALTSRTFTAGQYIVVEIGFRKAGTSTAFTTTLRFGDNAASDFAATDGLTTDLNPWVEFSGVIGVYGEMAGAITAPATVSVTLSRRRSLTAASAGVAVASGVVDKKGGLTGSASGKAFTATRSFTPLALASPVDDFNDGTINTSLWFVTTGIGGATVAESGGTLNFSVPAGATNRSQSIHTPSPGSTYDLTNRRLRFQVPQLSSGGAGLFFTVQAGDWSQWLTINVYHDGSTRGIYYDYSGLTRHPEDTLAAPGVTWVHVDFTNNALFADWSANGVTWTNFFVLPLDMPITALAYDLTVSVGAAAPSAFTTSLDNLNTKVLFGLSSGAATASGTISKTTSGGGGGATATLLASGALGWNNAGGATAFTTPSLTPGADRLLVLLVTALEDLNGSSSTFMSGATVVSSGSGPSWTLRNSITAAASYTPVSGIWSAQIGGTSPGSFTVTWTRSAAAATPLAAYSYALYSVSGFDTSTPLGGSVCVSGAGAAGNGPVTVTLSAAPASADITLAINHADDDQAPPKGATFSSSFGTWTEDADGASGTAYHAWNAGQRTGSTSTSVAWSDVNDGNAAYGSAQAAIVVKASAAGPSYKNLTGSAAGVAVASATIGRKGILSGLGAGVTSVTALLSARRILVASSAGRATTTAVFTAPPKFATSVSLNGRYLLDQVGQPYFIQGNSAQVMPTALTVTQMEAFFADQAARGFNSSQVHLFANNNLASSCPSNGANRDGVAPFTNMTTLSGPNEGYWSVVDTMFDLAAEYGFTLWTSAVDNISYATVIGGMSNAQCYTLGQFIGNRYKTRTNLIWSFGNDWGDGLGNYPNDAKYQQVLAGIQSTGDTHLVTTWLDLSDSTSWDLDTWDSLHDVILAYSYTLPYWQIEKAYLDTSPTAPQPVFFGEGNYEGEHWHAEWGAGSTTDETLRRTAWWPVTWGACGQFFGQGNVWNFPSGWDTTYLDTTAATENEYIVRLLTSFSNWHLLVPDTNHTLLTAGYGTHNTAENTDPLLNDYATAAKTPDGTLAIIYVPSRLLQSGSARSWTVNTGAMGTVTGYWYDPTTGTTSAASSPWAIPTSTHADGKSDWVLVLQGTGATYKNLTGSSAGATTLTVAISRKRSFVVTVAGVASVAVTIGRRRALTVTSAGLSTASATIGRLRALSATTAGSATVSVVIGRKRVLTAASGGVASVSVTLGRRRALTAISAGVATTSAVASRRRVLVAVSAGVASASAVVSIRPAGFLATSVGVATTSAVVGRRRVLIAASAGVSVANGTVTIRPLGFTGATAGRGVTTGLISAYRVLTVSAVGSTATIAAVSRRRALSAASAGSTSVAATITRRRAIIASSTGQATVSAILGARRVLVALAAGKTIASGIVTSVVIGYKALYGTASGVASASAVIGRRRVLVAVSAGLTSVSAIVGRKRVLIAVSAGSSSAVGTTSRGVRLIATATGRTSVSVQLIVSRGIKATAIGKATASGTISRLRTVTTTSPGPDIVSSDNIVPVIYRADQLVPYMYAKGAMVPNIVESAEI